MALIELRGRYAVGQHRYAEVDEAEAERLGAFKWKAKWNGGRNNIYAVRNEKVRGRWVTVRMHREVLGLKPDDPQDVDHLDHFGLNNRRENLRVATRSDNLLNARRVVVRKQCGACGEAVSRVVHAAVANRVNLCTRCAAKRTGRGTPLRCVLPTVKAPRGLLTRDDAETKK